MSSSPHKIVVIGAGATGTLVCAQLLRNDTNSQIHIDWVGDQSPFGRGLAYGTRDLDHLLNVRARGMSAFPDEPLHFLNWFRATQPQIPGIQADENSFLPRNLYGAYLEQLVPENEAKVHRHKDEALQVEGNGPYQVTLKSGETLTADEVVLALGNLRGPTVYHSITPEELQVLPEQILAHKKILLIGTGLTMLDQLLTLNKRKGQYLKPLTAVSRRGLVPRTHTTYSPHSSSPLFRETFMSADHTLPSLARALHVFRAECRLAMSQGSDWRAVFDEIRSHTQPIWSSLSPHQKSRFMRHIRPYWDVHRHRVAPEISETVRSMQEQGELLISKKRITPEFLSRFDILVDCTGLSNRIADTFSPLAHSLIEKELVATDHPPVSFHQSAEHPKIHVIGPLLRGSVWESIAIPEIRVQAETLAKKILHAST